jgi:hypothetical protein
MFIISSRYSRLCLFRSFNRTVRLVALWDSSKTRTLKGD